MSIRVIKKPLQSAPEIARIRSMDSVSENFPIKLRDDLRANSDGVTCARLSTGNEPYSSDRYETKEILVEAWLSGENKRYRRVLCMKVQRLAF